MLQIRRCLAAEVAVKSVRESLSQDSPVQDSPEDLLQYERLLRQTADIDRQPVNGSYRLRKNSIKASLTCSGASCRFWPILLKNSIIIAVGLFMADNCRRDRPLPTLFGH